ncbi:uncharacterized protein DDB_G0283697-like [Betta splendens]|uniref:Uncharacterized protein DDB_G0283697-like n=1 Tax=Betta splendens TaxID=158456 RepID=A0A6P7KR09_BETSP|nr:uncharacterized protein DDB_G0283697-like [Betta splendens]
MDYGAATPDHSNDATLLQHDINGEEDLNEQERVKQRAERRKAKKKRRRKRKKQEQVSQNENPEQDDEDEDAGAESELEGSASEFEVVAEVEVEKEETKSASSNKNMDTPVMASSGIRGHQKGQAKSTEEEPEWDVSSAFVANAASHIKPKGSRCKSKENKENEAKRETNGTDTTTKKSTSLTGKE